MSVSGVSPTGDCAVHARGREELKTLRNALNAGDGATARSAFVNVYKHAKHAAKESEAGKFRGELKNLFDAIKSGEMGKAKDYVQMIQSRAESYGPGKTGLKGQYGDEIRAVFSAVKEGNAEAAQSALSTFTSDVAARFPRWAARHGVGQVIADPVQVQPLPAPDAPAVE